MSTGEHWWGVWAPVWPRGRIAKRKDREKFPLPGPTRFACGLGTASGGSTGVVGLSKPRAALCRSSLPYTPVHGVSTPYAQVVGKLMTIRRASEQEPTECCEPPLVHPAEHPEPIQPLPVFASGL